MNQEANRRMGDYEILGELGSGGMGRVYRVKNVLSDRIEAMKVLLPDLVGRQELAARFLREIKVLASLDHPNIAQLRTAITVDNQLVMIMELVERKLAGGAHRTRPDRVGRCAELYRPGAERAQLCAPARCHSPRYQAGEHDADAAGRGEAHGFRHRAQ